MIWVKNMNETTKEFSMELKGLKEETVLSEPISHNALRHLILRKNYLYTQSLPDALREQLLKGELLTPGIIFLFWDCPAEEAIKELLDKGYEPLLSSTESMQFEHALEALVQRGEIPAHLYRVTRAYKEGCLI